jgi:hypothetical protein
MTWTDHADYLESLADEHRDDPAPKPTAPAATIWEITFWFRRESEPDRTPFMTRTVIAQPPNLERYTENCTVVAVPLALLDWARQIGASYDHLIKIDYATTTWLNLINPPRDTDGEVMPGYQSTVHRHEDRYQ